MVKRQLCILWATTSSGNQGVNALALSALRVLDEIAKKRGEKFHYHFVGTGDQEECVQHISGSEFTHAHKISFTPSWKISWQHCLRGGWRTIYHRFKTADWIVDLGEGDSFSNIYGSRRFLAMAWPKLVALLLRRPIILFPQTIGPFSTFWTRGIASFLLRYTSLTLPRDKTSAGLLARLAPKKAQKPLLDLAFTLPFGAPTPSTTSQLRVGLNLSGLLWNGGYTRQNMFELKSDYQESMKTLAKFFIETLNAELILIPHVHLHSGHVEHDLDACQSLAKIHPASILDFSGDPRELKSRIAECDIFLGSRMHACIAAFSAGVPFLPLAYSRKFDGLFKKSIGYPLMADLRSDDSSTLLLKAKQLVETKEDLRTFLQNFKSCIDEDHARLISVVDSWMSIHAV
jgi:colanic acid/amylovoran biosynthesis protein